MAFVCKLNTGQTVYLDNPGGQTRLLVSFTGPGQQQQSGSSFQTGDWSAMPLAFSTGSGLLIQITAAHGESYLQVQGNSISLMVGTPSTAAYEQVALQDGAWPTSMMEGMDAMAGGMPPIPPMPPMPSMNLGNMQMNPMQMRMGNMAMSMGGASSHSSVSVNSRVNLNPPATPAQPARKFCNQCGSAVEASDRFCSACGNPLQS